MGTDDREAILARRQRFIALALIGGAAVNASACACLSPREDAPDAGVEDAPRDAGFDAFDTGALPCLSPPPPDVPEDDAGLPDAEPEDGGSDDAGTDDDASADDDAGGP